MIALLGLCLNFRLNSNEVEVEVASHSVRPAAIDNPKDLALVAEACTPGGSRKMCWPLLLSSGEPEVHGGKRGR